HADLMRDVFGLGTVAAEAECDAENEIVMAFDQRGERRTVTIPRTGSQLAIRRRVALRHCHRRHCAFDDAVSAILGVGCEKLSEAGEVALMIGLDGGRVAVRSAVR